MSGPWQGLRSLGLKFESSLGEVMVDVNYRAVLCSFVFSLSCTLSRAKSKLQPATPENRVSVSSNVHTPRDVSNFPDFYMFYHSTGKEANRDSIRKNGLLTSFGGKGGSGNTWTSEDNIAAVGKVFLLPKCTEAYGEFVFKIELKKDQLLKLVSDIDMAHAVYIQQDILPSSITYLGKYQDVSATCRDTPADWSTLDKAIFLNSKEQIIDDQKRVFNHQIDQCRLSSFNADGCEDGKGLSVDQLNNMSESSIKKMMTERFGDWYTNLSTEM